MSRTSFVYTTLTQFKMAMNDGVMPPMTPIPEDIRQYIDPDLTIGMGALSEDKDKGLRCPVRGCGEWFHHLTAHLNKRHADIGGAAAVKRLLDIPGGAALTSKRAYEKACAARLETKWPKTGPRFGVKTNEQAVTAGRKAGAARRTMGRRNLANVCDAQLLHRLKDLAAQLGHSPTAPEASEKYGEAFMWWIKRVYGSWNSAKLQCGLPVHVHDHGHTRETIMEVLREFYRIHRRLPTQEDTRDLEALPRVPARSTILKKLGHTDWAIAMLAAAEELGIAYTPLGPGGRPKMQKMVA